MANLLQSQLHMEFVRLFRNIYQGLESFQDPELINEFETTFRERYSLFPMKDFLQTGTVSDLFAIHSLSDACKQLSEQYLDHEERSLEDRATAQKWARCAYTLWNPTLAADFGTVLRSQNPRAQPPPPASAEGRQMILAASTPVPPPAPRQHQQQQPRPKKDPVDMDKIATELSQLRLDLHGAGLIHDECKKQHCVNCNIIFQFANISRCKDNHPDYPTPCTPSGWYPHVSTNLWKKIRIAHNKPEGFAFHTPQLRTGQRHNPLRPRPANRPRSPRPSTSVPDLAPLQIEGDYQPQSPDYSPEQWAETAEQDPLPTAEPLPIRGRPVKRTSTDAPETAGAKQQQIAASGVPPMARKPMPIPDV